MKKGIALLMIVSALAFSGCTAQPPADGETQQQPANTAQESAKKEEKNIMQGEGELKKIKVAIGNGTKTKDYQDKPAIYVDYQFTNNSDKETSAMVAMTAKAFQDGVQLETAILMGADGFDAQNSMKEIKPGASLQVQNAYVLSNETSPVEIEVTETFDDSKKIVKTITLGE